MIAGADVGGGKLLLVAVEGGRRLEHRVETGVDADPAFLEAQMRAFLAGLGVSPAALGIAVPGLVDATGGVAACDVLPRIAGWRPADAFADLGCPVRVLNDAEAALAEEGHDLPADATAGVVMAGTAVGAAFRVDGRPLRGARGWAGELGYLPVAVEAEGAVRRLDERAGGAAMAARLGIGGAQLRARAEAGDAAALSAIHAGGEALGLGLASVINLLNPHLVAVGGGALRLPGYLDAALASARRHAIPGLWEVCTVRPVRAGDAVVALGAARAASQPG